MEKTNNYKEKDIKKTHNKSNLLQKTAKKILEIVNTKEEDEINSKEMLQTLKLLETGETIEEFKNLTIQNLPDLFNAEAWSFLFFDEKTQQIYFDIAIPEKWKEKRQIHKNEWQGVTWMVALTKEALLINDMKKDENINKKFVSKESFDTYNMICSPVESQWNLLWIIQIMNKKKWKFKQKELDLLVEISQNIWLILEKIRNLQISTNNINLLTNSIQELIEKDSSLKKIANYCFKIADQIWFKKEDKIKLLLKIISEKEKNQTNNISEEDKIITFCKKIEKSIKKWTQKEDVIELLNQNKKEKFDPHLSDLFIKILQKQTSIDEENKDFKNFLLNLKNTDVKPEQ